MQTLIIHGRQPALGRAELESLYGPDKMRPVGGIASILDIEPTEINFVRLGGMVKFCKVLTLLETTNWGEIQKFLEDTMPGHLTYLPEGKLRLGLSAYGLKISPKRLQATGLALKKIIKATGRSVRYVPNVKTDLNAAQVLHNQLTQKLGWELVFVADGHKTIVAQSIAVQDINKYAARDQKRPYRDAKVGMLPPKLAQIIINLAVGQTDLSTEQTLPTGRQGAKSTEKVLLDPFCGTGVMMQEAQLMGLGTLGSDIDPRMVEYSLGNLDWLHQKIMKQDKSLCCHIEEADATSEKWNHNFDAIASETFLGKPLSRPLPKLTDLQEIIFEAVNINRRFLQNIARQTKPGFRICLAVPAWKTEEGFEHLPTLDKLDKLGYNRLSFVHASNQDLIYHRPDQIVARELVVLERT